jgi:hypothetical protein
MTMEIIFDTLTLITIISVTCIIATMLVLMDCCKVRKNLHKFFSSE